MQKQKNSSGVSAIVLAAGSSTRMGTVKPLVHVGGKPMLERVLTTLRESHVDETIVVLGHSAQLIRENVALGDAVPVMNETFHEGMARSLQIGLSSVRADAEAALIVLADQPFLKPETIDLLIEAYRTKKPEIIVPVYNGFRGNPVLLDRSVFAEVAALTGDIGCRAIFGSHTRGILQVTVQDAGALVDLDTAGDVRRFEQSGAGETPSPDLFDAADLSGRDVAAPAGTDLMKRRSSRH